MVKGAQRNRVRIIAGEWRGRLLPVADAAGLRPSADRVRETLFNWLTPSLPGARVLDLFAGSGALGFEALSRGAAHATLVDNHPPVASLLRDNAVLLDASCDVIQADARALIAKPPHQERFDIVFIDPPFADNDAMQLCTLLRQNRWLSDEALIYVEQPRRGASAAPPQFVTWRHKQAGQVDFGLYSEAPEKGEA